MRASLIANLDNISPAAAVFQPISSGSFLFPYYGLGEYIEGDWIETSITFADCGFAYFKLTKRKYEDLWQGALNLLRDQTAITLNPRVVTRHVTPRVGRAWFMLIADVSAPPASEDWPGSTFGAVPSREYPALLGWAWGSVFYSGLMSPGEQPAEKLDVVRDESQRAKNEGAIRLLEEWLADDSGYDEQVWPGLKAAIEEHRLSYRKRFSD